MRKCWNVFALLVKARSAVTTRIMKPELHRAAHIQALVYLLLISDSIIFLCCKFTCIFSLNTSSLSFQMSSS